MALGADFHPDIFLGGTGEELVAAGAAHLGLQVFGVNIFFHERYLSPKNLPSE
jgi:hypothetical protein